MSPAPLLALFSDSAHNSDPERALLAAGFTVVPCQTRGDVLGAHRRGACVVLQTDALRLEGTAGRLARELPGGAAPVVVVTGRTSGSVRALADVNASAVVYYDEVKTSLIPTIERIQGAAYLRVVESRLRAARHVAPQLRAALCHACRSADPIISVTGLARRVGCDRSTLYRGWGRLWGEGEVTLDQFLDWTLLLRAIPQKRAGQTWASLARGLSVSERTLSRTMGRILQLGLRKVDAALFESIQARFESSVMVRLEQGGEPPGSDCHRMS
jgi:hypothetical protein